MWWKLVLTAAISAAMSTAMSAAKTTGLDSSNSSSSLEIMGGVCKADYGSRFNIDSKELGTTCVTRIRGGAVGIKPLSTRLRQAMDKMRQDFLQLQELIDQEANLVDTEPAGLPGWTSGALTVHREYEQPKEPVVTQEKVPSPPQTFGDDGQLNRVPSAMFPHHGGAQPRSQLNSFPSDNAEAQPPSPNLFPSSLMEAMGPLREPGRVSYGRRGSMPLSDIRLNPEAAETTDVKV